MLDGDSITPHMPNNTRLNIQRKNFSSLETIKNSHNHFILKKESHQKSSTPLNFGRDGTMMIKEDVIALEHP